MNRLPLPCIHYFVLSYDTARLGKPEGFGDFDGIRTHARMRTSRMLQDMVSGPRRMSRAIKRGKTAPPAEKSDHGIKMDGRCELDTRVDIIRADKNFRMLSTTGGVCTPG